MSLVKIFISIIVYGLLSLFYVFPDNVITLYSAAAVGSISLFVIWRKNLCGFLTSCLLVFFCIDKLILNHVVLSYLVIAMMPISLWYQSITRQKLEEKMLYDIADVLMKCIACACLMLYFVFSVVDPTGLGFATSLFETSSKLFDSIILGLVAVVLVDTMVPLLGPMLYELECCCDGGCWDDDCCW